MTLTLEPTLDTMNSSKSEHALEGDLAGLLEDLTRVQDDLLSVLARKRRSMARGDRQAMAELQEEEQGLCERLQACHDRRKAMLDEADQQGLPAGTLGDLASAVKQHGGGDLRGRVKSVSSRAGLLQHNCLANWVLAQKALLHASQMLEIIASGGRLQPTYSNRVDRAAGGTLVDQEA